MEVSETTPAVASGLATGLRSLAPWLVAVAACTALGVVLVAAPEIRSQPPAAGAASPALPARAQAVAVEGVFRQMTPYSVQKDMGPSGGKSADCSIYSDGDLDNGANVTWAVTLCVVHRLGRT